jgi:phosphatidylserine/phosphatidylglycerophosphate/cardiolipin synthase-like enzyme
MDASSLTQSFNSHGIDAFGIGMPILAQDWVPDGSTGSYTMDDTTMGLTVSGGNCAAPCNAAIFVVDPSKGQLLPVTLLNADGTAQKQAGVLLTVFEQAWLRLGWLYAETLETSVTSRTERALGLPFRQVPRYFYYPMQTHTQTEGMAEAQADLGFSGQMFIYDNDGLLIDPIAVMSAFNALMIKFQILQTGTPTATPALGTAVTAALATADVRVRIVNPDGTPSNSNILTGLTAVTTAPGIGVSTIDTSTAVKLPDASSTLKQDDLNRIVFGPSTSGTLTNTFTPPALPSGITLQRDFYTLRLVGLSQYLLGSANSADIATTTQPAIDVRINEPVTLLTNGNDVLGAVGSALVSGTNPTLAVAQELDGAFTLPTESGTKAQWPAFPNNATSVASATLSVKLSASLTVTAAYFNTAASDFTKADVVLTLTGFDTVTPSVAGAWVRVYTRLFGLNAVQMRGDGQGRAIPGSGPLSIYLTDPLGLKQPGMTPSQVLVPTNGTLNFDMIVVLPNGSARIYGGISANITAGPTPAPAFTPGTNASTTASFQGICSAGILGLGQVSSGPAPTSLSGWVEKLTGEGTPRDASRFPTMARRELLAAGLSSSKWTGVIGGGRLAKEMVSNLSRLGEPGGFGGRETMVTGASTQGGRLAYDIARHALRRGQNIIGRVVTLADSKWAVPAEPAAVALGQTPTGNSGTFAGALLQNVAPYCESPELQPLLSNIPDALDHAIDLLISMSSILPSSLGNQTDIINALNSLKNSPPSAVATPTEAALRIAEELIRELSSSAYGRRDSQWALASALASARHFVYIETPGFCSTFDRTVTPATAYSLDLIAALSKRLLALPGLRAIVCSPKFPDFAPGYEGMAAYEALDRYNILVGQPDAEPAIPSQLPTAQTVAFHPIGFPGRYSRLESTVVIVDDAWALIGGSTFRRRGLTFDGSSDLVLTDTKLVNGRSPAIRDFRRALMASRLGIPADAEHPSYVQLYDGQRSFQFIRQMLQSGGGGYIDLLWNGQTPGVTPTPPLTIAQANPDGRDFSVATAAIVSAIAASSSGV